MRRHLLSTLVLASLALGTVPATVAVAAPSPTRAAAASSTPTLRAGATGAAVLRVQRDLGVKQTGRYDAATVAAVKAFQKANRVVANGVVGSATWSALARAEKAVAAAKADFTKRRAVANTDLSRERSRVVLSTTFEVGMSPADQKLLVARLDQVRRSLDASASAVAKAGTLGQVRAQAGWPSRASTAAYVVSIQSRAVMVARADVWTALMTHNLDRFLDYSIEDGIVLDPAAEWAARQKVLTTGNTWRSTVAPASLTLFGTDPLASAAKGRADGVRNSLDAFDRGVTSKAYNAAITAYVNLVL